MAGFNPAVRCVGLLSHRSACRRPFNARLSGAQSALRRGPNGCLAATNVARPQHSSNI